MKTSFGYLLLALSVLISLVSCDVIEGPKVDPNGFTGTENKVLIEDFTGQMCGNCPNAHRQAALLKETYGENLVIIAVHSTGFATPVPVLGFPIDFRTPMGDELALYYEASNAGLPVGIVNRRDWNGSPLTRYANWGTLVSAVLAEEPKMGISLEKTYDDGTRKLDIQANLEYFTAGDANHRIVAVITEDSLISKQYDFSIPAQEVDEYVQNHVLRTSITPGTWGIPVKGNTIFIGEKIEHSFSITLDPAWRAEKCHAVVYVINNSTREILQVEEIKVIE